MVAVPGRRQRLTTVDRNVAYRPEAAVGAEKKADIGEGAEDSLQDWPLKVGSARKIPLSRLSHVQPAALHPDSSGETFLRSISSVSPVL